MCQTQLRTQFMCVLDLWGITAGDKHLPGAHRLPFSSQHHQLDLPRQNVAKIHSLDACKTFLSVHFSYGSFPCKIEFRKVIMSSESPISHACSTVLQKLFILEKCLRASTGASSRQAAMLIDLRFQGSHDPCQLVMLFILSHFVPRIRS